MPAFEIGLEPLCEVEAFAADMIMVGSSSQGIRIILPLTADGTVRGKRINGTIRACGGDWGLIRPDNCFELDVRMVIETDDGALIYTYYRGVVAVTNEQVERSLSGDVPEGLRIFVTPRFETGHENYQWLTVSQAVGRGTLTIDGDRLKVTYSWYTLT